MSRFTRREGEKTVNLMQANVDELVSPIPDGQAKPLNILYICNTPNERDSTTANAIFDYLDAFSIYSTNNIFVLSNTGRLPSWVDLAQYDAVVIHWSIYLLGEDYIASSSLEALAAFRGLKILFIQDEYRTIRAFWDVIRRVKFDVIFTCMPPHLVDVVYPPSELPHVRKVSILTGYVPSALCHVKVPSIDERTVDVFYRGRQLPYWLGRVAQEKHWVASEFERKTEGKALTLDLKTAEAERIYGDEWLRRLMNCRATIGVESAASILDFDGSIQKSVEAFMRKNPEATFEECERTCFPGLDGKWNTAQISPRIFEAIALRTPLILLEGSYSGLLEPGRHYIPLRKDFSNIDEVVKALKDDAYLRNISLAAFHEVALNPTLGYPHFISRFDKVIEEEIERRGATRSVLPIKPAAFSALIEAHRARRKRVAARNRAIFAMLNHLPVRFILQWMPTSLKKRLRSMVRGLVQ